MDSELGGQVVGLGEDPVVRDVLRENNGEPKRALVVDEVRELFPVVVDVGPLDEDDLIDALDVGPRRAR